MRASNYKTFRSVADKERDGGGEGGGGVLDAALPQGFDPLITQRVPLWYYFNSSIFGSDPKTFLKRHLAPIYTIFQNSIFWL